MKFHILTALCTIASAAIATADVPSLINYQGRLTDANGDPVTGSKNFAISIYDAATNGTLLYTETIGAVTLDDNGVYSFQFGGSGTSNTLVTETVATTNGTSTTFQKVLANSPVVANSVSVSDGTYTWSQSAGSSNEDQFGGAYSTSLRRVTANYYNGAPAAGRTITATYRYGTSGITGALSSGAEHWMAVSVDGTVQGVRQRVLAVPFAQMTAKSDRANSAGIVDPRPNVTYVASQLSSAPGKYFGSYSERVSTAAMPATVTHSGGLKYYNGKEGIFNIPKSAKTVRKISCVALNKTMSTNSPYPSTANGFTTISVYSRSGSGIVATLASQTAKGQDQEIVINDDIELDHENYEYYIEVVVDIEYSNGTSGFSNMLMASASNLKITVDSY
jgi:hypothetical protein